CLIVLAFGGPLSACGGSPSDAPTPMNRGDAGEAGADDSDAADVQVPDAPGDRTGDRPIDDADANEAGPAPPLPACAALLNGPTAITIWRSTAAVRAR